jgi:hypothetical protein
VVKALKAIALTLTGIVVGIAAIGLMLPRNMKAERSVVIKAPRPTVYARVADVPTWRDWILGSTVDPRCAFNADTNKLAWNCEGALGSLTIVDRDPDKTLWIEALMPGAVDRAKLTISLEDAGDGTKVTWLEEARAPGLVGGWITPFFRRARGEQIEMSLKQLDRVVTSGSR